MDVTSAPKVDDPERILFARAIGGRNAERTGLEKYVAFVHGSLDELGFM